MATNNSINSDQLLTTASKPTFAGQSLTQDLDYDILITSSSTFASPVAKIACNEAIPAGAPCKVSLTVNYRVEMVKTTDSTSIPIVGISKSSTSAAGETIEIYGMEVFKVVLGASVSRGSYLLRSTVTNGRCDPTGVAVPGIFAIALQGGSAGNTILAARILNELN